MKRSVVTNKRGDIIATGPQSGRIEGEIEAGAPTHHGFLPEAGQQVHEVEFPDVSSIDEMLRFHKTHRIRVVRGRPYLELRKSASESKGGRSTGKKRRRSS